MSKGVNRYFARTHYGVERNSYGSADFKRFFLAVLKIIEADGISDREKWAFSELAMHVGVPEQVVTKLLKQDLSKIDLRELLMGFRDGVPARAMLYDAMTIASIDGYSDAERQLARKAAFMLNVDERV